MFLPRFALTPLLFAALLLPVLPAQAEEAAHERLNKMVEAMRAANFEGVYVHVRAETIETMEVVHASDGQHEFERLTSLTGEPREVIRDDDTCRCTWPDRRTVVEGHFPGARAKISAERFSNPGLLRENYRIMPAGTDRIAGRVCDLIALVPRDALRYGYKLCVDQKRDMMLRMSVFNEEGLAVEHNFFTALTVHDEPLLSTAWASRLDASGFDVVQAGSGNLASAGSDEKAGRLSSGWSIDPLPPGYVLKDQVRRTNPVTLNAFEHYAYTDGLSTISVFVERMAEGERSIAPRMRMSHAVNTQTRQVGDYRVTVIGEAPQKVVEMFCENARPLTDH